MISKRTRALGSAQSYARGTRVGIIAVFLVVALPAIIGVVGLVFDGGLIVADSRTMQHAVDAGATASAMDILFDREGDAEQTAIAYVQQFNHAADSTVTVNLPPASGPFVGRSG